MTDQERRVSDANKAIMRRFYDEVVNAGNVDLIDELLADDFVEHEEIPGDPARGRDAVKRFFGMFKQAFPDGTFTVEQTIAEGDLIASRITVRGTHQDEFMGIPASGRTIEIQAIDIVRFTDGIATAHWGVTDMAGMLMQLGAMPGPG